MKPSIQKLKKKLILNIPFVLLFWLINSTAKAYHMTTGTDFFKKISFVFSHFSYVLKNPLPSFALMDIVIALAVVGALKLFITLKGKKKEVHRDGEEHGSARFGDSEDIQPFIDRKNPTNNILLSQTERITMGKPTSPKYARNKNVLVVGGSGSGKTRFFVKPSAPVRAI